MNTLRSLSSLLLCCLVSTAFAHHSNTPFDMSKRLQLSGVVQNVNFKNPHSTLTLLVEDAAGARTISFEGHSLATLRHYGLLPSMVKEGDRVSVSYAPRRDNEPGGIFLSVTTASGETLDFSHLGYEEAAQTAPSPSSPAACTELSKLQLPNTTIAVAETVAAGAFKPPAGGLGPPGAAGSPYANLPAFCRVAGTIKPTPDSDIRFEVWMPSSGWNGKFVSAGNGVWAGAVSYFEMVGPLSRGYATAANDAGHQGNPLDASFAAGHPDKLIDFGHRAPHETTVVAKATIAAFYGSEVKRSLFVSCSTGGRQGLMAAYRYPRDYDGISAMAPANPMTALMVSSLWTGYATLRDPTSMIPPPKLSVIHKAAVAACDRDDGVQDGIIGAPMRCGFDPASLQCQGGDAPDCLSAPQVAALRAIYQGPKNPRTGAQIYPGFERGSEALFPLQTAGPLPFGAALTYLRDLVIKDPQWDFRSFDYDQDTTRAIETGRDALDVLPQGLVKFVAGGGKLLLSHGWADGLIPTRATLDFYTALSDRLGARKTKRSVRLFLAPGMGHCAGGEGPFVLDMLATIDNWVETGRAPDRLIAGNPPGAPPRTRPLCPYPQEAVYSGTGSSDEEQNFTCKTTGGE